VREPLRATLIASIICQKKAEELTGAQAELLTEQATEYEAWALGVMGAAERFPRDEIALLLLQLPRMVHPTRTKKSRGESKHIVLDKWPESPLETAIGSSGLSCKRFLALRQCREVRRWPEPRTRTRDEVDLRAPLVRAPF
jgi:hypothetical protein